MIFKVKTEKRQQAIDIREAYNIWDILNSKYMAVERLQVWENFAHDYDFKLLLKKYIKSLEENIGVLEKQMHDYAIKSPDRNRSGISFPAAAQVVSDEFMAQDVFLYAQEHVENLLKVLRSTVTNDSLRNLLKNMAIKTINETDKLVSYLIIKGWLVEPPLYKQIPLNINEILCMCEAANLWDHLCLRYDNIKTTQIFLSITHDLDFKAILSKGLKELTKQESMLEKELQHFGIPLPKRPGNVTLTLTNMEVLDDDYMFRILNNALQGAVLLHTQSFKECIVNDRIRAIFKDFLLTEIDIIERMFKYGKLKGWLNPVPTYGP